jgi:hypothetical protein
VIFDMVCMLFSISSTDFSLQRSFLFLLSSISLLHPSALVQNDCSPSSGIPMPTLELEKQDSALMMTTPPPEHQPLAPMTTSTTMMMMMMTPSTN